MCIPHFSASAAKKTVMKVTLKAVTYFPKSSALNVWLVSKYAYNSVNQYISRLKNICILQMAYSWQKLSYKIHSYNFYQEIRKIRSVRDVMTCVILNRVIYETLCVIWYYFFQPTTLGKVLLLHGCFSRFLNCTNGTKSRKASEIKHAL